MKNEEYTQEQRKVLRMLRSLELYMQAHPHNQEHSEHADRLSNLEDITNGWLPKLFREMNVATGHWECEFPSGENHARKCESLHRKRLSESLKNNIYESTL